MKEVLCLHLCKFYDYCRFSSCLILSQKNIKNCFSKNRSRLRFADDNKPRVKSNFKNKLIKQVQGDFACYFSHTTALNLTSSKNKFTCGELFAFCAQTRSKGRQLLAAKIPAGQFWSRLSCHLLLFNLLIPRPLLDGNS